VIRKDAALLNSCDMHRVCGPDTMRNFFLNPSTNQSLKNTLGDVVVGALKKISIEELTLDNDWTFIESNKTSAEYSYLKTKGYGALLSCIPELDLVVDCDYRPGNTHPGVGIVEQIKNVSKVAADAGKAITKFRSDSAAHTVEVFNACEALNMKFYVSVSKTNHVKELIKAIPEYLWAPLPNRPEVEYSETLYPMADLDVDVALRLLVLRWKNPDPTLFDQNPYCYHGICTNDGDIKTLEWLDFHNQRMASENYHKEIKSGFGLDWCPSNNIDMNRNYFLTGILAFNLFQIFKHFYCSDAYKTWTVKTFRWRFFFVCSRLVSHARNKFYRLINLQEEIFLLYKHIQQKLCFV
jgi:hypothetical protein